MPDTKRTLDCGSLCGHAAWVSNAQNSAEELVVGIDPTPNHPFPDEYGSHQVGVSRSDAKQRARRSDRVSPATLPVPQRLLADAHHGRELTTRLVEQPPDLANVHGFELPTIPRSRTVPGQPLPQGA